MVKGIIQSILLGLATAAVAFGFLEFSPVESAIAGIVVAAVCLKVELYFAKQKHLRDELKKQVDYLSERRRRG